MRQEASSKQNRMDGKQRGLSSGSVVGFVAITFFLLFAVSFLFESGGKCYVDRYDSDVLKTFRNLPFGAKALLFSINALTVVYAFQLSVWTDRKGRVNVKRAAFLNEMIFGLLFHAVWWFSTYCVVLLLKEWTGDHMCNKKPNGVSGHFAFVSFLLLGVLFQTVRLQRDPRLFRNYISIRWLHALTQLRLRARNFLLLVNFVAIVAVCFVVLYRTYFFGFHTPRQIFLGIGIGFSSHFLFSMVFNNVATRVFSESLVDLRLTQLVILFASEALAFILLLFFSRQSIDIYEMGMNLTMLVFLLAVAVHRVSAAKRNSVQGNLK